MGRADKVWLGIAIVVIIVVVSGGGFLLYRRAQIAAAEQGSSTEATVTLTPIATSPPVPEPTATPKPRALTTPPAKGAQAGLITRVKQLGGTYILYWDLGKLENGEAARADAIQAHTLPKHGWYFSNAKHDIVQYQLYSKCAIVVSNPLGPVGSMRTLTLKQFKDAFPGGDNEDLRLQQAMFWIVLKNGRVVRVEEIRL